MRALRRHSIGFTLAELLVSAGIVGVISLVLFAYTSTALRLVARNFATNHSHDNIRISSQRMQSELHESSSKFTLVNFDGTTHTEVTNVVATTDADNFTQLKISERANGVRYWEPLTGPVRLKTAAAATDTSLVFTIPIVNGKQIYPNPAAKDRLAMPLLAQEYIVNNVTTSSTTTEVTVTATLNRAVGFQLRLNNGTGTGSTTFNTTGYFHRKVAYIVWDQQLRFYPSYEADKTSSTAYTVVRSDMTSPKPFGLLFDSSGSTDRLKLRVSMEFSDSKYSKRAFGDSTATLVEIVPPLSIPVSIDEKNTQ
jgi:type II secretory pathway pseudopilin PulG